VWLADDSLLAPLYARVQHLLPQQLEGGALARWRLSVLPIVVMLLLGKSPVAPFRA
jgi:hypothetical protein